MGGGQAVIGCVGRLKAESLNAALLTAADGVGVLAKFAPGTLKACASALRRETTLFRHVDDVELASIKATGEFRTGGTSVDGKYFGESAEHAAEWGRRLNGTRGTVVSARVPNRIANGMKRFDKLDGIGPARFVDGPDLGDLNGAIRGGIKW